ncbi:MAG: heavy metal translocating P-type ATPase metal-binding domain-containing protein [Saprospiraceae bacterium]
MTVVLDNAKPRVSTPPTDANHCYHCGEPCEDERIVSDGKAFCCTGCKTVYEILSENKLDTFYALEATPGKTLRAKANADYAFLDQPEVVQKLVDYEDDQLIKVSFKLPAIHCTSCIWLIEHLYKIDEGVLKSTVNFLAQEAHFQLNPQKITLRQLVELLDKIGYAPQLQMEQLTQGGAVVKDRTFSYQMGVAGFAFGNIMLLSFPEYLGLEESAFQRWFGYLNIVLSIPVLVFSAKSYWQSAWNSLRQGQWNIDVPISLGIAVLFLRSVYEIVSETGAGYLDSLAGLVFFLLIGRWFQLRTYNHLSFERNYQSYFPIAVLRWQDGIFASATLDTLRVGDLVRIQHNGLVPADGVLEAGTAQLDYSFVTGEAVPIEKKAGDRVFAGGRQVGGQIDVRLNKAVSQSYLTELWNDEAFQKNYVPGSSVLLNRIGRFFTPVVLTVAIFTLGYWWPIDHRIAMHAFSAVLIIACPCALALSVPFTLGNALRLLGKMGVYIKHTHVIESLHDVDTIVFDKTGTLTSTEQVKDIQYLGDALSVEVQQYIKSVVAQSSHPISRLLAGLWPDVAVLPVSQFEEFAGKGIRASVAGQEVKIGSAGFVQPHPASPGTWVKVEGTCYGPFVVRHSFREGIANLLKEWSQQYDLYLLSGDNSAARTELAQYFPDAHLHFDQSPHDKLEFIKSLQAAGKRVMMIGDGLNDAGALQQSEVGMVVTEDVNNFTPACDIILSSRQFADLPKVMKYQVNTIYLVYAAFGLAFIYNVVGLSYAVQGLLSPLIAAILMPLSSITIAVFGLLGSNYLFTKIGSDKSHLN